MGRTFFKFDKEFSAFAEELKELELIFISDGLMKRHMLP